MRRILGSLLMVLVASVATLAREPGSSRDALPCESGVVLEFGSAGAGASALADDEVVIEPDTDVVFAVVLQPPGQGEAQVLAGAGVRTKFIFDVYAVGLYVDPLLAHELLPSHRGKSGKLLADDKTFFADLVADELPKTLRLVMARDVDADDMRSAFDDALQPRLVERRTGVEREANLAALATFKGYFRKEYVEGTEMLLAARPGGKLTVSVDGELLGTITSRALVAAILDVYVGKDPISDDAKEAFGKGMPRVFARGSELAEAAEKAEAERRASESEDGADGDGQHDEGARDGESRGASEGGGDGQSARLRSATGADPGTSSGPDAQDALARQRRRVERATDLLRPASTLAARDGLRHLLERASRLLDGLHVEQGLLALHDSIHAHLDVVGLGLFADVDTFDLPPCPCEDEGGPVLEESLDEVFAWLHDVRVELVRRIDAAPRPFLGT